MARHLSRPPAFDTVELGLEPPGGGNAVFAFAKSFGAKAIVIGEPDSDAVHTYLKPAPIEPRRVRDGLIYPLASGRPTSRSCMMSR